MVILEIYSKCIKYQYKSRLCSKATLFILVTNFVLLVVPFVFAYRSRGFWLKHDTFYEQPDVRFKGEYLFIGITDNLSNPIVCNNFPYYQDHSSLDRCNKIKAREIDNNHDGKMDELYIYFDIDVPKDMRIVSFYLILPIDYKLKAVCPLHLQSAVIYQMFTINQITELDILGDLELTQSYPLFCHFKYTDANYNHSVIEDETDASQFEVKNILNKYSRRNLTTHLKNIYTTYVTDNREKFVINVQVRYPVQAVHYKPGFWQIIKHAWIQYFSIYVVFAWVIGKVKNYVFENRLILYYKVLPIKKEIL